MHKGDDYHETFSSFPHRSMIWSLERRLLRRLVFDLFPKAPPRYLDFACGTGRIIGHISPYCVSAVGVDVSASMLQIARRSLPDIELIEADITRDDQLSSREFDLITVFRFFSNAEPELRRAALTVLCRHLSVDGVLIFNNHKSSVSLRRRMGRAMSRVRCDRPTVEDRVMSPEQVSDLVAGAGLRIERQYHFAVLPFADGRMMMVPAWLLGSIERVLGEIRLVAPLAQNRIYVCRSVDHGLSCV